MKILFLTNDPSTHSLADWINEQGEDQVTIFSEKLSPNIIREYDTDFVISYNYRHLIKKPSLDLLPGKIINLHISYLPWNRGAHPNIWSFLDNTPAGVTIHLIDLGLDTGDILVQKRVYFDPNLETLRTSYQFLQQEILTLFKQNWKDIRKGKIIPKQQPKGGTFHLKKDWESISSLISQSGWDTPISSLLHLYRKQNNHG